MTFYKVPIFRGWWRIQLHWPDNIPDENIFSHLDSHKTSKSYKSL